MPKRQRAKLKRAKSKPRARPKPSLPGGSLRSLARRLGVSHTAVEKGLKAGRLPSSSGCDARGRPKILNLDLAVLEWARNASKPSPSPAPTPPTNGNGTGEHLPSTPSLVEAQRRVAAQREIKLDLENRQRGGLLIDALVARRQSFEAARTVRDAILNVPDRIAAELAAETDPGRLHRRLEEELRRALVSLAEILGGEASSPGGDRDAA